MTHTYATAGEFTATVTANNEVSTTSTITPVTVLPQVQLTGYFYQW